MEFVQIIEYDSDRADDMRALMQEWQSRDQAGQGGPQRVTVVRDRDDPHRFVAIAEFASYDEAMAYSNRPETSEFAAQMRTLSRSEPRFVNLDVQTRVTA